jgi:hypothetical protein
MNALFRLVIPALATVAAAAAVAGQHFDVYLVGGQSNADGRGAAKSLTGELAAWARPRADVRIFYANPVNGNPAKPKYRAGWTNLQPGFSVAPGYSGPLPSPTFGPEVSFGGTLAEKHPDRKAVLAAMAKVAAADPHSKLVSSEGLPTAEGTHFTTAAQVEFGRRFAAVIEALEASQ